LAHLSRFVIADFTDPKVVLQETEYIARNIAVPIKPIFENGTGTPPVTIGDLSVNHRSVLDVHLYDSAESLLQSFDKEVIMLCEQQANEFVERKRQAYS
jgi:hypothetical protein